MVVRDWSLEKCLSVYQYGILNNDWSSQTE